jgi:Uncharacterized ABC-type transport system, periplasmic component/surface lipoprotein
MPNMKKWWMTACAVLVGAALISGCGGDKKAEESKADDKMKVAFVYVSPIGDAGYTMAHDDGRKYVADKMPGVETTFLESVPEGADAERVITQLAEQGNKVIFTTSFGYMDPTINVAQKYPDTVFMHASGFKTADNVGNYFGRMYQARYLTGIVAGKATKTDVVGFVAPYSLPEVARAVNAFTLGAQSVNPNVKVKVIWTNTWYDPAKEKQAALSLIDAGADVIAQHQNTPSAQQAAEERGVMGIGYNTDMSKMAPNASLTSAIWNWGPYYAEVVESVQKGTWKSGSYWGGMEDGVIDLAPLGSQVADDTKKQVEDAKGKLVAGEWDVFTGPIKDQSGAVKVEAGQKLDDEALLSMDWFVEGVEGNLN